MNRHTIKSLVFCLGVLLQMIPAAAQDGGGTGSGPVRPDNIFSIDSGVRPGNGVVHWKIVNKSGRTVAVKFFTRQSSDKSRVGWVWPGAKDHVPVTDTEIYTTKNCLLGEQICYGATYKDDFYGKTYWGVGIQNDQSCKGCCAVCTRQEDVQNSFELHELRN